jgi:NAD(P)-dependent dehydrogenase (short-subunit alcohol dehydrogenase family)
LSGYIYKSSGGWIVISGDSNRILLRRGDGILNCVLPGAESPATKEWAKKFPEKYEAILMQRPMRRLGDSENDIAPVIAFLAGPDSCYYSGQCMLLDGAYSIAP